MQIVSYLRVSSQSQERSGLGLDAQRATIENYRRSVNGTLLAEYMDVQSGAKNGRNGLSQAIEHAKKTQSALVIAKLDRVSRRVSFIANLMESKVRFIVAELPNADEFQLHIYAALAQQERKLISQRTRQALAQAKKRGVKLGKNGKALAKQNKIKAKSFALQFKKRISAMLSEGMSYRDISTTLNSEGIKSFAGSAWHATTVMRTISYF